MGRFHLAWPTNEATPPEMNPSTSASFVGYESVVETMTLQSARFGSTSSYGFLIMYKPEILPSQIYRNISKGQILHGYRLLSEITFVCGGRPYEKVVKTRRNKKGEEEDITETFYTPKTIAVQLEFDRPQSGVKSMLVFPLNDKDTLIFDHKIQKSLDRKIPVGWIEIQTPLEQNARKFPVVAGSHFVFDAHNYVVRELTESYVLLRQAEDGLVYRWNIATTPKP